ncbi:MAG: hypothetical protein ABR923_02100 [Terracidiphilus sp.]
MSQLPESTSPTLAASPAPLPGTAAGSVSSNGVASQVAGYGAISEPMLEPPGPPVFGETHPQRIPRWLERSELFLRVLLRMYIGLAVCYAPWSRLFWDQNPIFVQFPTLSIYAANGAVRGIVSGLGLLNLWIAFHDAFRKSD